MEKFLKEMRRTFLLTSVPTLFFFALAFFAADIPLFDQRTHYMILVCHFVLALVTVPTTSWYLRKVISNTSTDVENSEFTKLARAYRIRITSLNGISYLTSAVYYVTLETSCIYLFGIMLIVVLLSYPSQKYLIPSND